jgi:hypothetical protein
MGCIGLFYHNFVIFAILGHKGSLVISFSINMTPRVGVEASIQPFLSHPSVFRISFFARCGCASCHREERREVRDLPNLPKSGRMFEWFPHLVDS